MSDKINPIQLFTDKISEGIDKYRKLAEEARVGTIDLSAQRPEGGGNPAAGVSIHTQAAAQL